MECRGKENLVFILYLTRRSRHSCNPSRPPCCVSFVGSVCFSFFFLDLTKRQQQVLGKYCEKLDPSMAFLAYKKAGGACDDDLLRVTGENGLFKDQARYLVEKQDMDLWAKVLTKVCM